MNQSMMRYASITEKNPREIVLLRGRGCEWKKCRFCDYHLDRSSDEHANYELNSVPLSLVQGTYHSLEVINSGSFTNLDKRTMELIHEVCVSKNIEIVRFECHWLSRAEIVELKKSFAKEAIAVKIKMGVESFDVEYREHFLNKGMGTCTPQKIALFADEVCLLKKYIHSI